MRSRPRRRRSGPTPRAAAPTATRPARRSRSATYIRTPPPARRRSRTSSARSARAALVDARQEGEAGHDGGLLLRHLLEAPVGVEAVGVDPGEVDEEPLVPGLRLGEADVELLQAGVGERLSEEREPLAAARLDEGAHEEQLA